MKLRQFGRLGDGVVNDFQWNVALGDTWLEGNQPPILDAGVVLVVLDVGQLLALFIHRESGVAALCDNIVTDNGTAEVVTAVFAPLVWRVFLVVTVILIEFRAQLERDGNPCHGGLVQKNLPSVTRGSIAFELRSEFNEKPLSRSAL